MKLRKRYMVNSDSGLPHAFVGAQSMCGLVRLNRTRTVFLIISRARAEEIGVCLKCQKVLEKERRIEWMERMVKRLQEDQRAREEAKP